jgi:hypothetical protein
LHGLHTTTRFTGSWNVKQGLTRDGHNARPRCVHSYALAISWAPTYHRLAYSEIDDQYGLAPANISLQAVGSHFSSQRSRVSDSVLAARAEGISEGKQTNPVTGIRGCILQVRWPVSSMQARGLGRMERSQQLHAEAVTRVVWANMLQWPHTETCWEDRCHGAGTCSW